MFELPIAADEYERRLERLLATPAAGAYSGELTFTGRVAGGLVRMRARQLSRHSFRLRIEGSFVSTPTGTAFRGRTLPPVEVFFPLILLFAALLATFLAGPVTLARNGWVGLGLFAIVAVGWHLVLLLQMGERVERVLRSLGE
jgi:hypothetical protein